MKRKNFAVYKCILLFAALVMPSCSGTSTSEYLNGDFIDVLNDTTPPSAILPVAGERVSGGTVVLQWTSKKGASSYIVEVAQSIDGDFTAQIPGSPFAVSAPDTVLSLDLPLESGTYCWRVRADITESGQYGQSAFESMDDSIYVYCPASVSSPDDTGMIGNISKPFQTIMRALAEADSPGIKKVKIAFRQYAAGTYTSYREVVVLKDGISLLGGYTPDFSESNRDMDNNKTIIAGSGGYTIIAHDITCDMVFEGFEVHGSFARQNSYAMHVSDCFTDGLVIRSNSINGLSSTFFDGSSCGVYLDNAAVKITDNTIAGGEAGISYGIMVDAGNPEITDNTITAGVAGYSYGIYNDGASIITGNTISPGESPSFSDHAWGVYNTSGVWISENTIVGRPAVFSSRGLYNTGSDCAAIIVNNVIMSGRGTNCYGVENADNSAPALYNNTIIGAEASSASYGLLSNGEPVAMVNNIIATEDSAGTSYGFDGTAGDHSNNCFWAVAGTPYDTDDLVLDESETVSDPAFDAEYRLTDGTGAQVLYGALDISSTLVSLAQDAFGILKYFPIDRDGASRTSGDGWSMGAYEY